MMDDGHFSQDGLEFIITRPNTPKPWINILTNGSYCALVSQTGGGYSFIGGPGYDRITRADPDIANTDRPGRYIFIRDNASGEYFSIGWQPVKRLPDWFECHHSPGFTTIASANLGITGRITFFVPLDDNLEIWQVSIENTRKEPADLSVFTYVEWVLGNFKDDIEHRQQANIFNHVAFHDNYIIATKRLWRRPDSASIVLRETRPAGGVKALSEILSSNQSWGKWAFIALTRPVDGFDCDKEAFIGHYGHLEHPQVVAEGKCTNSDGFGRDAVGVLQTRINIPPGEHIEMDVIVGITIHEGDPSGIAARYSEPGEVDSKLDAIVKYWDSYLNKATANTPDDELNRAFNVWDKYQIWVSARLPGVPSLYRSGSSIVNFRNSVFDLLGMLPMDERFSRRYLGNLLMHQYKDGSVVHHWEPRSDIGARTGHSDDPIWLILAITNYLKETADLEFLDERVPYYHDQSPTRIYEHLIRAIEYCLSRRSPRGLVLLGPGDWNETLDQAGRGGRGESVLASQMLHLALIESAEVARRIGDHERAGMWRSQARELKSKLNTLAWNGEWYIRAISDRESPIGSRSDSYGNIFLVPQTWAVISGSTVNDRASTAMNATLTRLDTPYGPALLLPAYPLPDKNIGTITRFSPGMRENGGIVTTTAAWAVIAECMLGHGSRAYDIFRRSLSAIRSVDQDQYSAEPYVYAEFVNGPDSSRPGQGSFTWTSSAASWMWRACIDWIFGIRPDYPGLRIDPCIPSNWNEFTVVRPFRDAMYQIHVKNPDGIEKGVREIFVDGKKTRDNWAIHDFRDYKLHEVEVIMGIT